MSSKKFILSEFNKRENFSIFRLVYTDKLFLRDTINFAEAQQVLKICFLSSKKFFSHRLETEFVDRFFCSEQFYNVYLEFHRRISALNFQVITLQRFVKFLRQEFICNIKAEKDIIFSVLAQRCDLILDYVAVFRRVYRQCNYTSLKSAEEFLQDSINLNIKNQIYQNGILDGFSRKHLSELFGLVDFDLDLMYNLASYGRFRKFYLCKDFERNLVELPQIVFFCCAILCTAAISDPQKRVNEIQQIYFAFSKKKISLATSIILNLRVYCKTNNNKNTYSSCFILQMDDSLEHIFKTFQNIAIISKRGGGIGLHLSKMRGHGGVVGNNRGVACGTLHISNIVNSIALMVDQGGKRKGAITVAHDIWHWDILDFLEIQIETGSSKFKAFDIFPQIVVQDYFLECVRKNKTWYFFDPYEIDKYYNLKLYDCFGDEFKKKYQFLVDRITSGKIHRWVRTKKISAKELLKKIIQTQIETGLPYIFFKNNVNSHNYNSHDGMIYCGNLCMESYTNFRSFAADSAQSSENLAHVCNLCSLNLSNMENSQELEQYAKLSVRILNYIIDLNCHPLPETQRHDQRYRSIGIGTTGLHDYLSVRCMRYNNAELHVEKLYRKLKLFACEQSMELSKSLGCYDKFENSKWYTSEAFSMVENNRIFSDEQQYIARFRKLIVDVRRNGMRNGYLFAIAPNTSTSIIQNSSASVLPIYTTFYNDSNSKGLFPIFCRFSMSHLHFYKKNTFYEIDMQKYFSVIAAIQRSVCQGISAEVLYNLNKPHINGKYMFELFFAIHKKKIKTLYYTRTHKDDIERCANKNVCSSGLDKFRNVSCDSCTN